MANSGVGSKRKRRGKTRADSPPFRFLDLPAELRNSIYDYAINAHYHTGGTINIMNPGFRLRPAIVDLNQQTRSEARDLIADHGAHFFAEHDFEAWCGSQEDLRVAIAWVKRFLINSPPNHKLGRKLLLRVTNLEWSRGSDLWPVVQFQWNINSNAWKRNVLTLELKYGPVAGDKVNVKAGTKTGRRFQSAFNMLMQRAEAGGQQGLTRNQMWHGFHSALMNYHMMTEGFVAK